ncbi:transactivator/viroplasmin protein, partial [Striga asiatica]
DYTAYSIPLIQVEESKEILEKQLDELSKLMAAFDLGKNHENSDDEKSENQNDLVYGFSSDDEFEDEPADNPFNVKIVEGESSRNPFKRKRTIGQEKEFYRQKFEKHHINGGPGTLDIDCVDDINTAIRDWYNTNSRGEIEETIKNLEKLQHSSKSWADQIEEEEAQKEIQTSELIQNKVAQARAQQQLPSQVKETNSPPSEETVQHEASSSKLSSQTLEKNPPPKQEKVQTEDSLSKEAYVIFDGLMKGVYKNWNIAKLHIIGKPVRRQKYPTYEDALKAYKRAYHTVSTDPDLQTDKSLGYSKRIATQQLIQRQLKDVSTEPNEVEFHRNWKWLTEYSEEFTQECFYPANSITGVKAVFLTGASPTLINSFFKSGLISTIYLQESEKKSYAELEELPGCIRKMANQFNKLFAKGKEIYLKLQSTYPYFDEGIIIRPKHIVKMGLANGSYPEIQKKAIKFTYKMFVEQINQFYNYSRQWGTTNTGFKVLAEGEGIMVISNTTKKATEWMVNKMIKFEEDLINIKGNFEVMPEDLKHFVCEKLQKYEAHKCSLCPEEFPPLKEEEKCDACSDVSKSDNIKSTDPISTTQTSIMSTLVVA